MGEEALLCLRILWAVGVPEDTPREGSNEGCYPVYPQPPHILPLTQTYRHKGKLEESPLALPSPPRVNLKRKSKPLTSVSIPCSDYLGF